MGTRATLTCWLLRGPYWLAVQVARWGWTFPAEYTLRLGLRAMPGHPGIHLELACLATKKQDWDSVYAHAMSTLMVAPGNVRAVDDVHCVYSGLGRDRAALALLEGLCRRVPDNPVVRMSLGYSSLRLGHRKEALAAFRAWTETEQYRERVRCFEIPDCPLWDGQDLDGSTILLWSDQGFGDALQFIRYAPCVANRGGTVVVGAPPELARVLGTVAGVSRMTSKTEDVGEVAYHLPLFLLPTVLGTTGETIPNAVPYLVGPGQGFPLPCRWPGTLKVGLAWAADKRHEAGNIIAPRSLSPAYLYPLLSVPGVEWYSLQVGPSVKDLAQHGVQGMIHDLSPQLTDFAETARVIQQLDVVISVDTAVAHLAGALGRPTWVLLPYVADSRWMTERTDSPWYPSMTLFRQTPDRVWMDPLGRVAAALQELVKLRGVNLSAIEAVAA